MYRRVSIIFRFCAISMLHYELCTGKCTFPGLGSPFNLEKERERERKGERERKRKRGREGDKEKGSSRCYQVHLLSQLCGERLGPATGRHPPIRREREGARERKYAHYLSLSHSGTCCSHLGVAHHTGVNPADRQIRLCLTIGLQILAALIPSFLLSLVLPWQAGGGRCCGCVQR